MKKIISILLCAFILILSLGIFQLTPVEAQQPDFSIIQVYWGSGTDTVQAKPGDENVPLNVVVQNIDTVDMLSVTAALHLRGSPFTTSTDELTAYAGVTSIAAGQSQTFTFMLNINPEAELKTYTLTLDITSITPRYMSGVTSTVTIPVQLLGEVRFSAYVAPQTITPGSNDITFNIVNKGQASALNVEATVTTAAPLVIISEDSSWFLSEVKPSDILGIDISLYAPYASSGNAYTISIGLSYVDGYGFDREESLTVGVIVEIPTVKPIININSDRKEITAGKTELLTFTVSNEGQIDAEDVNIALSLPTTSSLTQAVAGSPIILVGGDNFWHFDTVKAESSETFEVYLTTNKDVVGTFKIEVSLNYLDSRGQRYSETRSIGLSVAPKSPSSLVNIESYVIKPDVIRKGEDFALTFNIKNFGDFEAQKVTVQLVSPPLFATLSPSLVSIGDLLPNEMKQVKYDLSVSPTAQAGVIHTFEVDITFTDSLGVTDVSRSYIGIPLHGTVDLIVYDTFTTPSPAEIGKEFTLSVTVLNRGTVTAMYTNLSIIPEFPFTQIPGGFPYIGELDINAPAPISLSAIVSPDAEEGVYPLKLAIYYQDEYNQPHTVTKEIQIPLSHHSITEEIITPTLNYTEYIYIGAIIVVAAIAGLTVFLIRRRKSSEE